MQRFFTVIFSLKKKEIRSSNEEIYRKLFRRLTIFKTQVKEDVRIKQNSPKLLHKKAVKVYNTAV